MKTDSCKIHTLRNSGIRTVEYGRILYIDVALHTFSIEQVHTAVSYNPIRISYSGLLDGINLNTILKGKSITCLFST